VQLRTSTLLIHFGLHKMNFEFFIAQRYFFSKKGKHFIGIISFLSMLGICIGVAALVTILSVFNGFNAIVTDILVGFDPHLKIESAGKKGIVNEQEVIAALQKNSVIISHSSFVEKKTLLQSRERNQVVLIRGVDVHTFVKASGVASKIVLGKFALTSSDTGSTMVIGFSLADKLSVVVGDVVTVVSPDEMENVLRFIPPQVFRFRIAGIYESKNQEYDANYAFVSLPVAQKIFHAKYPSGIDVRLNDIQQSDEVKKQLASSLHNTYSIATWYDLHKDLYSVMNIERWAAYIILSCIIGVAVFSLFGSLTMTVIQKHRDIGVLRSMGVSQLSIQKIFLFEGICIGMIGTIAGIILGLVIVFLQDQYHLFPLDPNVYIIPAIPVEIRWMDFFSVSFASLFLTSIASYFPSARAGKIIPVEAIRWE